MKLQLYCMIKIPQVLLSHLIQQMQKSSEKLKLIAGNFALFYM